MLHQLCYSAPYFSDSDLAILELLKDDFFIVTLKIFPDTNLKPKAHFLRQYGDQKVWSTCKNVNF